MFQLIKMLLGKYWIYLVAVAFIASLVAGIYIAGAKSHETKIISNTLKNVGVKNEVHRSINALSDTERRQRLLQWSLK